MSEETKGVAVEDVPEAPKTEPPKTEAAQAVPPPKEKGAAALLAIEEGGVHLRNLEDLLRFARMIVEGGMAPSWAWAGEDRDRANAANRAASAVAVAIQAGLEHGLGVLGGLQCFVVIESNLSWRGQAAVAKVRNSGKLVRGSLQFGCRGEGEQRSGWCRAHRIGDPEPEERVFTWQEAREADLLKKKNWQAYPKRMFMWRAVAWLTKDLFSDVLGGFPLAEEAEDFTSSHRPRREDPSPQLVAAKPDPLMDEIRGNKAEPEGETVLARGPLPFPFPSHAEADRAIEEAEEQGALFPGKK